MMTPSACSLTSIPFTRTRCFTSCSPLSMQQPIVWCQMSLPFRFLSQRYDDSLHHHHRCIPPRCLASSSSSPPPSLPPLPLPLLLNSRLLYAAVPSLGHHQEGHPESNQRVASILSALETKKLTPEYRGGEVLRLDMAAVAPLSALSAVHSASYIKALEQSMSRAEDEGLILLEGSGPTYATPTTFSDCLRASGAALSLLDAMAAIESSSPCSPSSPLSPPPSFALIRPPGHHAVAKGPMGFCLVDHVAVAARYAQQQIGWRRVFIVDFDVHHGNGTNDMFFSDPDIFFLSTHQLGSFPGTGGMEEVGEGAGEGSTLNLPLPGGAGDAAMAAVMDQVIAPAILNFRPDIILVSAGYDAHFLDPLAGLQFTDQTYHRLCRDLHSLAKQVCNGRIAFFLEGGYNLSALGSSVVASFQALLGERYEFDGDDIGDVGLYEEPMAKVKDAIEQIRCIHSL